MPSTIYWKGTATAVAQVSTATPANVEIGDVFNLICNGKTVTFTAAAATVANVTAGLTAAWNASTVTEHAEITATDSTTHVTLTSDTAGVPFTVTSSVTDGGGNNTQTLTMATPTANAGPNDASSVANYSGGALPGDGDTLVFENSDVDCLYTLSALAAVNANITIKQSYTGNIGLPVWNASGYYEYRPQYLSCGGGTGAFTITIGQGEGYGSGRLKLDTGAGQATVLVYGYGTRAEYGIPCLLWKGTHASNAVTVNRGDVGIAYYAGEVATVTTLSVGYLSNQASDATVTVGSGTTLTTLTKDGGVVTVNSSATCHATTVTQTAGTLYYDGSGVLTTLNLDGGRGYYSTSGTLTTAIVGGGGVLDMSRDNRARTISACDIYQGASVIDPQRTVTWTAGIDLVRCGVSDVTLTIGENLRLTPGSVA